MQISISDFLLAEVHSAFWRELERAAAKKSGVRHRLNAAARDGFSPLLVAVASVEAFTNEFILSRLARQLFPDSPLWTKNKKAREGMPIKKKVSIAPQLLLGVAAQNFGEEFEEFSMLVDARHDIVHYKPDQKRPDYIASLVQRGIAQSANHPAAEFPWPLQLHCTETIRWAFNTARNMIWHLVMLVPEDRRPFLGGPIIQDVNGIQANTVIAWFLEHGLNPHGNGWEGGP